MLALKEMHAFHADRDAITRRFVREFRLAGSLSHPNIAIALLGPRWLRDGRPNQAAPPSSAPGPAPMRSMVFELLVA